MTNMERLRWGAIWFVVSAASTFGISKCNQSEWYQASERADAARALAERTPHVIREADGCKVYAFKTDDVTHYFTKCGSTVTTDRQYTESCGKKCTTAKTESITTEGNGK